MRSALSDPTDGKVAETLSVLESLEIKEVSDLIELPEKRWNDMTGPLPKQLPGGRVSN